MEKNIPVAFFSLELDRATILQRMISDPAKVEIFKFGTGFLWPEQKASISNELKKLSSAPFFIDDTAGISIAEICFRATRLAEELNQQGKALGLIIIDYLQLIRPLPRTREELKGRQQEMEEVAYILKDLAKRLDVPVVVLAQLTRKKTNEENNSSRNQPQLRDVREINGNIADVVAFIHRESYYHREDASLFNRAALILAKHPRAFLKNIEVAFYPAYGQFGNPDQLKNNNTEFLAED